MAKKLTKAEREERDADYERVMANVRRTRELAEKAQAKLDAQRSREAGESVTLTAVFTPDEDGWTTAQFAEWPAVMARARTVEEAREQLLDAARKIVASYRDEGRESPIGHAERVTIDIAAA
jgi:predicted RNase H-like HicB family nuclease